MITIRLGTRKSPLALAQAEETKAALLQAGADAVEIHAMTTSGDENKQDAIAQWGFKGLFTKEIEEALLSHHIDIAVHSMKDMPSELPKGLMLAAMLPREDIRDALVGKYNSLDALPQGATIGTASTRRGAQLKALRPDLNIAEFRGSVQTRLRKLADGEVDATMLAVAGLNRLGMQEHIACAMQPEQMLPAIGQGAVGIECRSDDTQTRALLGKINHHDTFRAVECERIILLKLDGSCKTPIAAYAQLKGPKLHLRAQVLSEDGSKSLHAEAEGEQTDWRALAQGVAEELLAQGATELIHG